MSLHKCTIGVERRDRDLRLQVVFKVERVPLLYRNVFMSFLKEVLRSTPSGERRFRSLFYYGQNQNNKAPKPFCFAVRFLHDKERFAKDKEWFYLTSPLSLYPSVADLRLFVDFYNGLLQKSVYPFQRGEFVLPSPTDLIPLRERPVSGREVFFRTPCPSSCRGRFRKTPSPPR